MDTITNYGKFGRGAGRGGGNILDQGLNTLSVIGQLLSTMVLGTMAMRLSICGITSVLCEM